MRPGFLALIAVLIVLAIGADATFFTVPQTAQALLVQLGEPRALITIPGLHARLPLVQTVILFDRRLLDDEMAGEEVILGDQRRLIVDSFTRYRITDPLHYYQAVGPSEEAIRARLDAVVSGSLRRVLGGETLLGVLSADRDRIMREIRRQANGEMAGFGIVIEDVRIRRADLPAENTQAILSRMQSERERVAKQARAEGAEAAAKIRANAERERTVLLADARGEAERLRGEGEQKTIALYAGAYQQDPQFFAIWRTLAAYRDGLAGGQSRLILSPEADFFRYLRQVPQAP
ncbi:MAG: protease modulator HflC [Acidibrevibacterium sp.]|uniref:protease modulator HflC n=1 Tax=Acidibrevibacterium sp. TaxID=2606776 RepID=UPI003D01DE9A